MGSGCLDEGARRHAERATEVVAALTAGAPTQSAAWAQFRRKFLPARMLALSASRAVARGMCPSVFGVRARRCAHYSTWWALKALVN